MGRVTLQTADHTDLTNSRLSPSPAGYRLSSSGAFVTVVEQGFRGEDGGGWGGGEGVVQVQSEAMLPASVRPAWAESEAIRTGRLHELDS